MKRIWMSALTSDNAAVQKFMGAMKPYGLKIDGHFWTNDLDKNAWAQPRNELIDPDTGLWVVLTSAQELGQPDIRYGLSMLALAVQAHKGAGFPVVILQMGNDPIESDALTTPLKGAHVLPAQGSTTGAKLVAKVHQPSRAIATDYRIDVYGHEQIGQWFEIGPREQNWQGALFGVTDGEITMHAVGAKGRLPEKSVLNYPVKGLELNSGETNYNAWGVQNLLEAGASYYVKVEGQPRAILFGPMPEETAADVYIIKLT